MVDMHAATAGTCMGLEPRRAGIAERLACWYSTRRERRRAEALDRMAWDHEASRDRLAADRSARCRGPVVPQEPFIR